MVEIKLKPNEICVLEVGERYTLFKRGTEIQPYVVAFCYDSASGSWAAGHYFNELKNAVRFFYQNDSMFADDILSADDFAAEVMKNGTEVEPNEYETMSWQQFEPNETVWTIYAHLDADGDPVCSRRSNGWTLTANMTLTEEQSKMLINSELDDEERRVIQEEIYPQYVKIMKEEVLT